MKRIIAAVFAGFLSATLPSLGMSTTILLESDLDRITMQEIYLVDYATRADLLGNVIGAQNFSALDVNPLFSAADFAFDGGYSLLLETDADRNAGSEVYFVHYYDLDALRNNIISSQMFLPLDVNPLFSIGGFTFGAGKYSMLLESRADRNAGSEVYFLQYNTLADMMSNTIGSQFFLPLDINPFFSLGGFGYNRGGFQVLLESDADRTANSEVYFLEYASLADMTTNTISFQQFLPLDVNPFFSIVGFEGSASTQDPPVSLPEPGSLAGMMLALVGLFATRRIRNRAV